jgi:hypothetical protein
VIRTLCQISKDTVAPPKRCSVSQPISPSKLPRRIRSDRVTGVALASTALDETVSTKRLTFTLRFTSSLVKDPDSLSLIRSADCGNRCRVTGLDLRSRRISRRHKAFCCVTGSAGVQMYWGPAVSRREIASSVAGSTFLLSSRPTCSLEPFSRVRHCICPSDPVNCHSRKTSLRPINDRKGDISDALG